jgi:hypothetical protein
MLAVATAPARAGGPSLAVGVADEGAVTSDPAAARARMSLIHRAGLAAVRIDETWSPGETTPTVEDLAQLRTAVAAAKQDGIRPFLSVYPDRSSQTPLTAEARQEFARFTAALAAALPSVRDFIVGNEPNLNDFWLPQFNPDGSDAAAPADEALLAQTYDALKAVSRQITVIGGALAPHGGDNPRLVRPTHSPTAFIADLGAAYRASGRTRPIMDELALHPYEDNASVPPGTQHPSSTTIALADYGKLVADLGQAFDGTAQPGSSLPILYDEFGVQSTPPASKGYLYSGTEQPTVHPVSVSTQAAYYRGAIALAFCQPHVTGIFFFLIADSPDLADWQSGLYYADGTPKPALAAVRAAVDAARRGVVAHCPGLHLPVRARVSFPTAQALRSPSLQVVLTCSIDCDYRARLERLPGGTNVAGSAGRAVGGKVKRIRIARPRPAGRYRLVVRAWAPVNPGPVATFASRPFSLSPRSRPRR